MRLLEAVDTAKGEQRNREDEHSDYGNRGSSPFIRLTIHAVRTSLYRQEEKRKHDKSGNYETD